MLSPTSNFNTAVAKKFVEPVFLFAINKDYQEAKLTAAEDWQAGSGGDTTTVLGSLQITRSDVNVLGTVTGYGDTEVTCYAGGSDITFTNAHNLRLFCSKDTTLKSIKFEAKSSDTLDCYVQIWKIVEEDLTAKVFRLASILPYTLESAITFAAANTYYTHTVDFGEAAGIPLLAGEKYLIRLFSQPSFTTITVKEYKPDQNIFGTNGTYKGYGDGGIEIGEAGDWYEDWIGLYHYDDGSGGLAGHNIRSAFSGYLWIKEFNVSGFVSATHTSIYKRVLDSSGVGVSPSTSGTLVVDSYLPAGTSITSITVYGDADGSPAGEVNLGAKVSGDSVAAYNYYKFVIVLASTSWFATPQINAVSVFFEISEKYVMSDEAFGAYLPLIKSLPSFEAQIDPISNKASLSELRAEISIQRTGYTLGTSAIETLLNTYFIMGQECKLYLGFKGLAESDYLLLSKGFVDDIEIDEKSVTIVCKDVAKVGRDPLLIDSNNPTISSIVYYYQHPIDVIVELLSSVIPSQYLSSSWTTIKSLFTGWKVYRPILETEEDRMKLVNELCELLGLVPIQQEDGKLYPINLYDESTTPIVTFDSDNSKPVGMAALNLQDRVNICSVRREFWDKSTFKESDTKQYDQVINTQAMLNAGRNNVKLIENKWIDITTVGGYTESYIVADRFVNFYPYGVWTVKRSTDYSMAKYQIGDIVYVTTDQINFKGHFGSVTKRAAIVGKKLVPESFLIEWTFLLIKATVDSEPSADPSGLSFTSVANTSMTLNFTKAGTGTIILMKAGSYPSVKPIDGVVYAEGSILSDGSKVVYVGTGASKNVTGLTTDVQHYFNLHSYNDNFTVNYRADSKLQGAKWTTVTEPANQPTSLVLTVTDTTTITASWTAAAGATNYLVLRHASSAVTQVPVDGNTYARGDVIGGVDTVAYFGSDVSFQDTGLTNGVTYHYAVFSVAGSATENRNYKTGTPLTGNKACTIAEPTAQVTGLTITVWWSFGKRHITAEWVQESPKATGVIILAKVGTISDSPTDTTVYNVGDTIGSSTVLFVGDSAPEYYDYIHTTWDTIKAFTYNGTASPNYYLTGAPQAPI